MIKLPVSIAQPLIVFTDIDGTLIDHHTYSAEGSRDAMRMLAEHKVPLVFCSSKTFAEQVWLQGQLGINLPFIFENGSAIAIPSGFFHTAIYQSAGMEHGYELVVLAHTDAVALRAVLASFKGLKGYADASDREMLAATGLQGESLQRSRARMFTETLLSPLDESQADEISARLKSSGFTLSRGGRFYTVQSDAVNKGKAVQWLMRAFHQEFAQKPCFAAIGDSPNDVPMLKVVDASFLVQKPDCTWANLALPTLIKIEGIGPDGFTAAVRMLLGA